MSTNSDIKKSPFNFLNKWQEISSDFRLNMLEKAKLSPAQVGIFENLMNQMGADVHSTFRNTFAQQKETEDVSLVQEDVDEAEELSGQDDDILAKQDEMLGNLLKTNPTVEKVKPKDPIDSESQNPVNIDAESLKNPGVISSKDQGTSRPFLLPNGGNVLKNPINR